MKRKLLLILSSFCACILIGAQYSSGAPFLVGTTGVSVKMETKPTMVRLTLSGPSNSFLGLGAGDEGMASGADGFIYNSASARDYTFNGVGVTPSADAVQDWTVTSNTISGSTRTVVATRSLSGGAGDAPIPNAAGTVNVFVARGDGTLTLSYHGAGNRDYATLVMSYDAALAADDVNLQGKIMMYPNPSKGTVNFKNSESIKSILVYDSTGRFIVSPKLKNSGIDLNRLSPGTYFLEIEANDGVKSFEKLIKN
ncbi:T9SS type A sorting domain-containing protein [Kaistella faecalis]|uniref:T9SS type A sorting domain-containing protein n=1 Tax=Kaistella faecalis TaxID=2852098 RepID=UPI001C45F89E|nr:T9SS type A sorting domain-containing protein [Chryseobacterium faecale]UFK98599.1 T9SS type A sorting domain-containing protein [Chryseobacterium faecale]